MERRDPRRTVIELVLFSILLGLANALTGAEPGFLRSPANPYVLLAFLAASVYGKYWGFLSAALSSATAAVAVPPALALLGHGPTEDPEALLRGAALPVAIALGGSYVFGIIRDAHHARSERALEKTRSYTRDVALLEREIDAIQTINAELEDRVTRQQDSLTYLYSRIQSLYSLNLDRGIETILETAARFSGATSCSIWEHRPGTKSLELVGSRGWSADAALPTSLPAEGTIEGWVVRNNLIFSVRMLMEYDNLKAMDRGRSILSLPIPAGRRVWGLLNIEDMPFEKYNQHTEKLLEVLIALCAPAMERALEYASVATVADVNELTGLPSFPAFFRVLERTAQRMRVDRSGACVLLFEIANYPALLESHDAREILGLYPGLASAMVGLSKNRATVYHYKEVSQLAVLYPDLDKDGAVLFGLDVLAEVHARSPAAEGQAVRLEMILGYAVLEQDRQVDDTLRAAESLLEMQKL